PSAYRPGRFGSLRAPSPPHPTPRSRWTGAISGDIPASYVAYRTERPASPARSTGRRAPGDAAPRTPNRGGRPPALPGSWIAGGGASVRHLGSGLGGGVAMARRKPKAGGTDAPRQRAPDRPVAPHVADEATPRQNVHAFPVVGIGASAGGLDALKEMLRALPA